MFCVYAIRYRYVSIFSLLPLPLIASSKHDFMPFFIISHLYTLWFEVVVNHVLPFALYHKGFTNPRQLLGLHSNLVRDSDTRVSQGDTENALIFLCFGLCLCVPHSTLVHSLCASKLSALSLCS